jgi:DNA-binding NtrC family response regulator
MASRDPLCVVIVVDDEAIIRMAMSYALEDEDFLPLEAGSAEEAIAILEREAASIHVVFTDVRMPGDMDGVELARHVRRHWPHIGLIAASGHSRLRPQGLPSGCRFVTKPYDLHDVVGQIRELTPDDCSPPADKGRAAHDVSQH